MKLAITIFASVYFFQNVFSFPMNGGEMNPNINSLPNLNVPFLDKNGKADETESDVAQRPSKCEKIQKCCKNCADCIPMCCQIGWSCLTLFTVHNLSM
jgi:hypothetical protein